MVNEDIRENIYQNILFYVAKIKTLDVLNLFHSRDNIKLNILNEFKRSYISQLKTTKIPLLLEYKSPRDIFKSLPFPEFDKLCKSKLRRQFFSLSEQDWKDIIKKD